MTFGDLFNGNWTVTALLGELLPLAAVTISAFYAGYWRGRNVEAGVGTFRKLDP